MAFIYYNLQKENMLQDQNNRLKQHSFELIPKLQYLHDNFGKTKVYPRFSYFNSAIYDSSGKLIFSTLKESEANLRDSIYKIKDKIHYVRLLETYYLGAMYIVIEISDDEIWLSFVKMKVIAYGIMLFLILLIAGYFLLKIFLKPMRDSIYLLDRFIKDTTHELNTPITAILTNIEMIDEEKLLPKAAELGQHIMGRLAEMKEHFDCISESRGRGRMIGIELDIPGADLVSVCLEKGLRINCTHETVLRFMPALTATKEQVDEALDILQGVLAERAPAIRSAADTDSPSGAEE